jgi:hypothetical protein
MEGRRVFDGIIKSVMSLLWFSPAQPAADPESKRERDQQILSLIGEYAKYSRLLGPCDRAAAEAAVTKFYNAMSMSAPKFLWFDSPLPACRTLLLWDLMEAMLCLGTPNRQNRLLFSSDAIRTEMNKSDVTLRQAMMQMAGSSLTNALGFAHLEEEELWAPASTIASAYHLSPALDIRFALSKIDSDHPLDSWFDSWHSFGQRLDGLGEEHHKKWTSFADIFWTLPDDDQRSLLGKAVVGEHNNHLLSPNDATPRPFDLAWGNGDAVTVFHLELVWIHKQPPPEFQILRETVKHCGWWRPEKDICFMVDRATVAQLDDQGRLNGRMEYVDGYKIHAIHGIQVSEDIAEGRFTAEEIDAMQNVEVRRVMIEMFGADKYLKETGAEKVHEDEFGTLFRKSQQWDEPLVMVKVKNSTPEPDGSYKDYFLRVPPGMRTAREAVAWTFDVDPKKYKPQKET